MSIGAEGLPPSVPIRPDNPDDGEMVGGASNGQPRAAPTPEQAQSDAPRARAATAESNRDENAPRPAAAGRQGVEHLPRKSGAGPRRIRSPRSSQFAFAATVAIAAAAVALGLISTIILVQPANATGVLAWPGFDHAVVDIAVRSHAILAIALLPVVAFAGFRRDAYYPDVLAFFAVSCAAVIAVVLITRGISSAQPLIVSVYLTLLAFHALLMPYGLVSRALQQRQRTNLPAVVPTRPQRPIAARAATAGRSGVPARTANRQAPYDAELIRELAVYLQQWPMWRRMQHQSDTRLPKFGPQEPPAERTVSAGPTPSIESASDGAPDSASADDASTSGSTYSQLVGVGNLLQRPTRSRRQTQT